MNNYEKLINVLREVFQIDQADLDFGIYRIMNQKREEVNDFLENKLIPQVKDIITKANLGDASIVQKELDEAIAGAKALGVNPDDIPKIKTLKEQLSTTQPIELIEEEVFSHLAAFFKRYYDKGDFISLRRYKKEVYAIPYEGEEVKLYWANHDQYYIKSTEYLKNYQFKVGSGKSVRFELVAANTEQNNNKAQNGKERQFRIYEEKPLDVVNNSLEIFFTYLPSEQKAKREELNAIAFELVKKNLPSDWVADVLQKIPSKSNGDRTLLEKHINEFTARNTFDYFIHKDLGGFLRRELDFYIKNEVLHIDDINIEDTKDFSRQLTKIKALKVIAQKVIAFLEQLENFQKRLWLKKKFVVETNYCITIDKIPENYYPEIADNNAQWEEWEELFVISELPKDLFNGGGNANRLITLKEQPFLLLDTKFFNSDFNTRLLAEFENLDELTNGLLINSENFQALGILQETHKNSINCIYIDPPYNTSENAFLYKNGYKHSSWLSLLSNGLKLSPNILPNSGIILVAIDDTESANLKYLLEYIFESKNYLGTIAAEINPAGQNIRPNVPARSHDYFHIYSKDINSASLKLRSLTKEEVKQYKEKDSKGRFYWDNLRRRGGNSRPIDRPKQWFPLYVKRVNVRVPNMNWDDNKKEWIIVDTLNSDELEVFPIDPKGEKRIWRVNPDGARREIEKGEISVIEKAGRLEISKKSREPSGKKPKTLWYDSKYSATSHGSKLLIKLFGSEIKFSYPKSIHLTTDAIRYWVTKSSLILDYFAGSGTTGHAVINLNREDDGNRKYILVEMGSYFDTVTKPRIQKVIYSDDWKDGKPISRKGSSNLFKYIRLESYEDTLNNLRVIRKDQQQNTLALDDNFHEEYLLGYMLDTETQDSLLSIKDFINPFNYKLTITENNEPKTTIVDMIETFNYLIGLKIATIKTIDGFRVVTGTKRTGESTLIIWRNMEEKKNDDLLSFFQAQGWHEPDKTFQHIYVNGDNTLENLQKEGDTWKVYLTEKVFLQKMFDIQDT